MTIQKETTSSNPLKKSRRQIKQKPSANNIADDHKLTVDTTNHAVWIFKNFGAYAAAFIALLITLIGLQDKIRKAFGVEKRWEIWAIATAPLIWALVFHGIPAWLRRRREKKLQQYGIDATAIEQNYFRLTPIGDRAEDKANWYRMDNVHEDILSWIKHTNEAFLYLTGQSGTGKTSLLSSYVLPSLNTADANIYAECLRGFGDPLADLKHILQARLSNIIPPESTLQSLLTTTRDLHPESRLLLIFDQFEEFLITHRSDTEEFKNMASFLTSFKKAPMPGVQLLFVLRSDYVELLQEFSLPLMQQNQNWKDVPAFTRHASKEFLEKSGLKIGTVLCENLLDEMAEMDEPRGLIRPITLNMVGFVLERMQSGKPVNRLRRKVPILLSTYLEGSLKTPDVRDCGFTILGQMISRSGTKLPQTVDSLSAQTKIKATTIRGCMSLLSQRGLVRLVDPTTETWEISHDFVARLLRGILSGWKRSFGQRLVSTLLPVGLVVWSTTMLLLPVFAHTKASAKLRRWGEDVTPVTGGTEVTLYADEYFADTVQQLQHLRHVKTLDISSTPLDTVTPILKLIDLTNLDMGDTHIANINGIETLTKLETLDVRRTSIPTLVPLRTLKTLRFLYCGATPVSNLDPLTNLIALKQIYIPYCASITSLKPLESCSNLEEVGLEGTKITDVKPISKMVTLKLLDLDRTPIVDISPIAGLTNLLTLYLNSSHIHGIDSLTHLTQLTNLSFSFTEIDSLSPICNLTNLDRLGLSWTKIRDISALTNFTHLTQLFMSGVASSNFVPLSKLSMLQTLQAPWASIEDVNPLASLSNLRSLSLEGCARISDISALSSLTALTNLSLKGTSVKNIEAISHLPNLTDLSVSESQVSDLSGIENLDSLKRFYCTWTSVTNLQPTGALKHLQILYAGGCPIQDLNSLIGLDNLEELDISFTQVKNVIPLKRLRSLKKLWVTHTDISRDQIANLRESNPDLAIYD